MMKNSKLIRAGRLWLEGVVLLVLRLVQLRSGFDPGTGLALPSMAGRVLWGLLLVCLLAELVLCLRQPKGGKRSFACCFQGLADAKTPGLLLENAWVPGLIAGGFLLAGGGALLLAGALPPQDTLEITAAAAGLLGVAGGVGVLLLAKKLRNGDELSVYPLLPSMFFSVLFLLSVYFPEESNPVLDSFYLPVLAAGLAAFFLYQLSGFFQREGSLRWFGFMAGMTVITSIAAAADGVSSPGRLLVHLSFAVTATIFLLLQRAEPLPEPEEPAAEQSEEEPA